jgi:hypothetical protein
VVSLPGTYRMSLNNISPTVGNHNLLGYGE